MKLNEPFWAAFHKVTGELGGSPESIYIGRSLNGVLKEIRCWAGIGGCGGEDLFEIKSVKLVEAEPAP